MTFALCDHIREKLLDGIPVAYHIDREDSLETLWRYVEDGMCIAYSSVVDQNGR